MTDKNLFSGQEADERLAAAVTPYGVGTRSYNRSAEKREIDRQRKAATEAFESSRRTTVTVGPICTCRSFQYPHEIAAHERLFSDFDWKPWSGRKYREIWKERIA